MRIDEREAVAGGDVLRDHVGDERTLTRACLSDDVEMTQPRSRLEHHRLAAMVGDDDGPRLVGSMDQAEPRGRKPGRTLRALADETWVPGFLNPSRLRHRGPARRSPRGSIEPHTGGLAFSVQESVRRSATAVDKGCALAWPLAAAYGSDSSRKARP